MRTVLYGDVFSFAMTPREIHHFLIHDRAADFAAVSEALAHAPYLQQRLHQEAGYVACHDRRELIPLRQRRERISEESWQAALGWGMWLGRLPFVRAVALTGALAMRNPHDLDDDFDYLLVTAEGRVWLARAFSIVMVRVGRLRGVTLCPNYVVAENALEQTRRDLYIAHEVTQAIPLYGADVYAALRAANPWTQAHLPNAEGVFHAQAVPPAQGDPPEGRVWRWLKRGAEWALSGRVGGALEGWEHQRKARRFARAHRTDARSAARIDRSQVKGHFNDHGQTVVQAYHERLCRYGLLSPGEDEGALKAAGD